MIMQANNVLQQRLLWWYFIQFGFTRTQQFPAMEAAKNFWTNEIHLWKL